MRSVFQPQLFILLLLLLPNAGCSFATFNDAGRSNFASSTANTLGSSLEQTRPRGLTATTKDGRTVLLNEGTWEYVSGPAATSTTAVTANGQVVLLRSDGSWIFQGLRPQALSKTKAKAKLQPPSFLHFYQLGGGRGKATIFLDGRPIAYLREKRYFIIRVRPGSHELHIFNQGQGGLSFNTASGMHYYLKNSDTTAWWGEKLSLMDVATGQSEISRLKPLKGVDVLQPGIFLEPQMASRN